MSVYHNYFRFGSLGLKSQLSSWLPWSFS